MISRGSGTNFCREWNTPACASRERTQLLVQRN